MGFGAIGGILSIFIFLVYLGFIVLFIYCAILFIKLAHRAIKALDIYLYEKSNRHHY